MNKYTLILIVIVTSTFFMIARCDAGEVTVDGRSLLHVGASGLISFPAAILLKKQQNINGMSNATIIAVAGSVAMVPGGFKETVIDAYIDWGDMGFNAIGAYGGAWLGVKTGHYLFMSRNKNTNTINYAMRW